MFQYLEEFTSPGQALRSISRLVFCLNDSYHISEEPAFYAGSLAGSVFTSEAILMNACQLREKIYINYSYCHTDFESEPS